MAPSKAGFIHPRTAGRENDGDISWCKYVCGFLKPDITSQEYSNWRNAVKRKMEQERIPSWNRSTAAQWAAIQEHSLTLAPIASAGGGRAALWQTNTVRGEHFTECLDFLLRDIAKKHRNTLESLTRVRDAAPIPAGNDRKLSQ